MKRIKIQSVHGGGEYEVELTLVPQTGTAVSTRYDATGHTIRFRMDRTLHGEFLNAASQWVHEEATKHRPEDSSYVQ